MVREPAEFSGRPMGMRVGWGSEPEHGWGAA